MNTPKNPPLEKLPNHICSICHLTRAMHQYPYPDRKHLFTEEKTMSEETTEDASPLKERAEKPPCAVCGKPPTSHRGRCAHAYEPMGESAAAARRRTQAAAKEARASKAPRKKRGRAKRREAKPASNGADRQARMLNLATEIVKLQHQLSELTAEFNAELLA